MPRKYDRFSALAHEYDLGNSSNAHTLVAVSYRVLVYRGATINQIGVETDAMESVIERRLYWCQAVVSIL